MDEKTTVVEAVSKTPLNKYHLIGFAAGVIVTGAVALAVKLRQDKENFDNQETTVA
jgi:hypothetical protein